MNQEKMQSIALMRYSAIAPLISGTGQDYASLDAFFRAVSDKGILHPDGHFKNYAPNTIEKWYRKYQKLGFDSLLPSSIYRQLRESGSITQGQVSESTVNRYVNRLASQMKTTTNQDMRRYERPHINEVWCGDSSVGPYLKTKDGKKHKVYIIALIDDASRFIVGIDIFFNDNFVNLMSVLKSAVAKYGRPGMFNFDNGSSYKNKQMELLAARIGSVIHYDQPYTPTQKAKIERWFRTMKDQWMAALDIRDFHSLEDLRGHLFTYVARYNQTLHSSLQEKSPQDRFFLESQRIRRLSEQEIDSSFLLEMERRVSADSVIVIDHVEYEVDFRFAKQRIKLRYSPSLEDIFIVEADGTLTPIRLLNKQENASIKREKIHLCRGEE